MPDTFTANFDFTQPEVGGSDETWGDKLNANWGALDTLLREIRLSLVGQVSGFAATTAPDGWLKCNGQAVSRTTYADLWTHAQASGNLAATEGGKLSGEFGPGDGSTTFSLPDYRGKFLRAWDDSAGVDTGRAIGSEQASANLAHGHSGSTASAGGHSHSGTTAGNGGHSHSGTTASDTHSHSGSANSNGSHSHTGSTASGGAHTHDISTHEFTNTQGSQIASQSGGTVRTDSDAALSAGSHSHSLNINSNGAHTHSLSINGDTHSHGFTTSSVSNHTHTFTTSTDGAHTHTVTVTDSGGSEARPINNAYMVCIKH